MFSTARWRLALWFAGVFTVLLVLIGGLVFFSTRTTLLSQADSDITTRAARILGATSGPNGVNTLGNSEIGTFATSGGYFYNIIPPPNAIIPRRLILYSPNSVVDLDLPTRLEAEDLTKDGVAWVTITGPEGDRSRVRIEKAFDQVGRVYYFEVGRSIQTERDALRRLAYILILGGGAGLLFAGLAGYWLAGRALRPIQVAMNSQRTFVADASHEIRTPLTLIRANAEVLKRETSGPPDQMLVDDIIRESDRLTYLIGQMLTLARSDSDNVKLETAPVVLGSVAEDIARQMRLLANEKNITINVNAAKDAIAEGDEQRLGELLIILIDNALKYSDVGATVTVGVARDGGRVQLTVADTGRGIAAEALPHVFDRFYRADKARSREQGGTGLGLAIAHWIVEQHNGSITVDSIVGQGTAVTVDLPGLSADPADAEAAFANPIAGETAETPDRTSEPDTPEAV